MTKVIIIHGLTGHPDKNWFPWLKQKLEEKGIEVLVPQMPEPDKPKLQDWLTLLNNLDLGDPSELYMVGHSLGCPTILRYLEQLAPGKKIAAGILVAGFAEPIGIPETLNFLSQKWNDKKIKSSAEKFVYFNSDNDPYVPLEDGEHLMKRFGGELIKVHNAGHFNWRDGYKELPAVYDKLQELIGAPSKS